MASLIGSDSNQIPTNAHLGGMAFQDPEGIVVEKIQSSVGLGTTAGSAFPATNLQLQPISGNVIVGAGTSLGTTATSGFLFVPSCSGAPTGVPIGISVDPYTGVIPMVVDTTNLRIYVRIGSTWRYATLT